MPCTGEEVHLISNLVPPSSSATSYNEKMIVEEHDIIEHDIAITVPESAISSG